MKKLILVLSLLILILSSCQLAEFMYWMELNQSVSINITNLEALRGNAITVQLTHTQSGESTQQTQTITSDQISFMFNQLSTGAWQVSVKVTENGSVIASGNGSVHIQANSIAYLDVYLNTQSETGSAEITVHFNHEDPPVSNGEYIGMFLGVAEYDNPANNLDYTDDDAIELDECFTRLGMDLSRVITPHVLQQEASQTIMEFRQQTNGEPLFIFAYSGHGTYINNSFSALCLSDYDGGYDSRITVKELRRWLDSVPGIKLVLIDACKAGGFVEFPPVSGRETDFAEDFIAEFFSSKYEYASENTEYLIMVSSNTQSFSYEADVIENGLFSFAILDGLGYSNKDNPFDGFNSTYSADANGDRQITFIELFNYVEQETTEMSEGAQKTLYSAFDETYVVAEY